MPLILIADDDTNFVTTTQEVLVEAGYDVSAAPNGEALLELYEGLKAEDKVADAILLDVLMPKIGGFDCAQMLLNRHYEGAILFTSGVFKTAQHEQDAKAKYGAKAYLPKPFRNEDLTDVLADICGVEVAEAEPEIPQVPLPAEGSLLENPVIYLLFRIHRERHTGVLDLYGEGKARFRLFFYNGRCTLAQSPYSYSNIGVALIRTGALTADMYQQAAEWAVSRGTGLYDIIKSEKWADDGMLKEAYRSLLPEIVGQCIALSGRFRWTASGDFSRLVPAGPMSVLDLIKVGLRMATAKDLAPHLDPRKTLRLAPGEKWGETLPLLQEACGSNSLERAINGRATIAQLLGAGRDDRDRSQRARQVYLLMSNQAVLASEQVIKVEAPEPAPKPQAPSPTGAFVSPSSQQIPVEQAQQAQQASTPAADTAALLGDNSGDEGIDFTPEELEAKQRIDAKTAEVEGKNYWEVLGVQRGADAGAIKAAYFALARDFHTDAFAGMRLGASQPRLDHVFTLIADAYATLTNDDKRGEYEAKIDMEEAGMTTDVGALLEADKNFHKGTILLERGQANNAARLFAACVEVNPSNLEWQCYYKYANWFGEKNPGEATALVSEFEAAFKEMPAMAQIAFFGAKLAFEIGNHKKAKSLLRKTLGVDPDHHEANRLMRQLNVALTQEMQKGQTGGGLMGRFLKR